jgi:hypothetical protein
MLVTNALKSCPRIDGMRERKRNVQAKWERQVEKYNGRVSCCAIV